MFIMFHHFNKPRRVCRASGGFPFSINIPKLDEAVLKICASPMCHQEPSFLSPRAHFFVAPNEVRGPSALTRLGMTFRDAVPNEVRDASLSLGRTKRGVARQDKVEGHFF